MLLKYGFCKKLLRYKLTSDQLNTFFLNFCPDQCSEVHLYWSNFLQNPYFKVKIPSMIKPPYIFYFKIFFKIQSFNVVFCFHRYLLFLLFRLLPSLRPRPRLNLAILDLGPVLDKVITGAPLDSTAMGPTMGLTMGPTRPTTTTPSSPKATCLLTTLLTLDTTNTTTNTGIINYRFLTSKTNLKALYVFGCFLTSYL